jgi:hypothetical protein
MVEQRNDKLKFKLIIQSFAPLFVLILIKYFDSHVITSTKFFFQKLFHGDFAVFVRVWTNQYLGAFCVSILSVAWIVSGTIALWQFKDVQMSGFTDDGGKVAIEEEMTESGITFFMTFVFPLLLDDLTTFRGFLLFSGILTLIFLLMWKTNLYYQNPILTILGYKVYRVHFLQESDKDLGKKYIAICKEKLDVNKIVKWKVVSDDVLLIYNKNKNAKEKSLDEYGDTR